MKNTCDILLTGYEDEENLGLRSIAAFLIKNNVQTVIEPFHPSLKEKLLERICVEKPQIVGFSLIFQSMLFEFADLIAYLRQNRISSHFTMGGHFPTLKWKETLETIPGLTSVVRHEGEHTLLELYQKLDQPDSWERIKGIAYRRNGKIRVTPPRPLIRDLDLLPPPVRSDSVMTHRGLGICSMLASRGCYYNCSFCSIHQFYREPPGPMRRTRSPSNVVEEMEYLFKTRGVRIFIFKDDDLCTKGRTQQKWIEDFANELRRRNLADKILWRISCRVDEVDTELMEMLKDVGLTWLYLGIESGSNQGLKTFNKHYTVNDIFKALDILQELEIHFDYGFMILHPDSTMDSITENIAFLRTMCKDGQAIVHFTKTFPYAGTPIAERMKEEGRLKGTMASPDYTFNDKRLELLQYFLSRTFHSRNFDRDGLVNQLQMIAFDTIFCERFFPDTYGCRYAEEIRELTRQSNELALETMNLAVKFMENRSYQEILDDQHVLQYLTQRELCAELYISAALNRLGTRYGFRPITFQPLVS